MHVRSVYPAEIVNRVVRHPDLVRFFDAANDLYRRTTEQEIPREFGGAHRGFEVWTASNFALTNFRDAVVVSNGQIYGLFLLRQESQLTFRLEECGEGNGKKHCMPVESSASRGAE